MYNRKERANCHSERSDCHCPSERADSQSDRADNRSITKHTIPSPQPPRNTSIPLRIQLHSLISQLIRDALNTFPEQRIPPSPSSERLKIRRYLEVARDKQAKGIGSKGNLHHGISNRFIISRSALRQRHRFFLPT